MSTNYSANLLLGAILGERDLFDVTPTRQRGCKPTCNYVIPDDAKFCSFCGSSIKIGRNYKPTKALAKLCPEASIDDVELISVGTLVNGAKIGVHNLLEYGDREPFEYVVGCGVQHLDLSNFGYDRARVMPKLRAGLSVVDLAADATAIGEVLKKILPGQKPPAVRLFLTPSVG